MAAIEPRGGEVEGGGAETADEAAVMLMLVVSRRSSCEFDLTALAMLAQAPTFFQHDQHMLSMPRHIKLHETIRRPSAPMTTPDR